MRKETLEIISLEKIAAETYEIRGKNKYLSATAEAGQFLHISVQNFTLRRPISIAAVDQETEELTIIFKVFGSGTRELSTYQRGMSIDVLGPSGNGFPLQPLKKALLIGGGVGVPPLYYLGHELAKQGTEIITILGFQTKAGIFYENEFSALGKTYITTNDGSYGHHGFVTDVIQKAGAFDQYFSCGPAPMLKAVKEKLADQQGYLSLEEHMGCGVGACFACVVPTDEHGGYKKICQDGPVFQAEEIIL